MTKSRQEIIDTILKIDPSYSLEELNKLKVHQLLVLRDSLRGDSDSSSDSEDISTLKNLSGFKYRA